MKNPISLYIHFPFCAHLCNYCDFYKIILPSKKNDSLGFQSSKEFEQFSHYLEKSLILHQQQIAPLDFHQMEIDTLFVGGGTPSLWGLSGVNWFAQKKLKFTSHYEWTIEVNPNSFTKLLATEFSTIGVNRWSMGVQTMDPTLLPLLDRIHHVEDVHHSLEILSQLTPLPRISVDFMLGIPQKDSSYQRDIIKELDIILTYPIEHLSLYILTTKKNYPLEKLKPSEDWIHQEFLIAANYLQSKGFIHYEVSNFAKTSKAISRHNMAYWKGCDVYALGPSASGHIRRPKKNSLNFPEWETIRYKWLGSPLGTTPTWEEEILTQDQIKLEKVYLQMRLADPIPLFKENPAFHQKLQLWQQNQWVTHEEHPVPTSLGLLFMDCMVEDLLEFL